MAGFVLGWYRVWKETIGNIREHGAAGLQHTLNVLTMPGVPLKLKADLYCRYTQAFQEFSNGAAGVETEFMA